jgi:arsenate reductase
MSKMSITILYVCVHNAGRSQMAEAFTRHLAQTRGLDIRAQSAGTEAGATINPKAVAVMAEIGISLSGQYSKLLTQAMVDSADRIVTMGCGVDAATCPARIYLSEDWGLDDPKGATVEQVRTIRDQIRERVEMLLSRLNDTDQKAGAL